MKYTADGNDFLVKLDKGELLISELTKFVTDQKIPGAWIGGVGAALWAELGFYDLENKEYLWKKLDQELEILSLQGNIAWKDDAPALHIHGVLSDKSMQTFGGHVKELAVGGTCEVFIHRKQGDERLQRFHDETTGLNLLDIR